MSRFTPAQQRYNRRVLVLSVIYALVLFASIHLIGHHLVGGALAYAVGVVPALAVSGFFLLLGRYLVEETDEYMRMLQTRQVLIATGVALTASTLWGFLEGFALLPHLVAWAWPVVWFAGLWIGAVANIAIERRAA